MIAKADHRIAETQSGAVYKRPGQRGVLARVSGGYLGAGNRVTPEPEWAWPTLDDAVVAISEWGRAKSSNGSTACFAG